MLNETYNLDDAFSDELDYINDQLSVFCEKTFSDYGDVIKYVEYADSLLRSKGLYLHYDDVENIRISLEEPYSPKEAVNFIIPVYKDGDQSEYNLVVTYYQDSEDSEFEIDMELQYVWEIEIDDSDDYYFEDGENLDLE